MDRVKAVAAKSNNTYAVTNNHCVGKATVNALEIASLLKGEPVRAPPLLVEHRIRTVLRAGILVTTDGMVFQFSKALTILVNGKDNLSEPVPIRGSLGPSTNCSTRAEACPYATTSPSNLKARTYLIPEGLRKEVRAR